jgi:hypothetical protein
MMVAGPALSKTLEATVQWLDATQLVSEAAQPG